ncbi:MAG: M1 family aminopeptidase [Bacteroidales bacterium]|jgi:aminopeptidase N|nr:T9SS type A sorting domain-containing protein [Bacteroidales bacterium]MDD4214436.1 M1 family aminopeptidase [Bacteroidales bacterium]
MINKIFFGLLFLFSAYTVKAQPSTKSISDTVDILNYDINLRLVNLSTKNISGFTTIKFTPKVDNLASLKLDLLKLHMDSVHFENAPLTTYNYNDTVLSINLPSPMNMDDTAYLSVFYHGAPQVDASGWGGFYFTNDSSYAYNLGVGFEAVPHNYGRVWFPCIDDFVDRATYDCRITVKNEKMAVCGGTLVSVIDNGDNTSTYYWRLHDPIPTYLASVAVGPYVAVQDTFAGINGDIPISIYVPSNYITATQNSFIHLKEILTAYETRFGPYRWERVGYVGVPFDGGAMEHAANIAYPLITINGNLTYESLYAHELAHNWFGNLVTCSTAGDMWINEGWARHCEAIYQEHLYGIDSYKQEIRDNHLYVVRALHIVDDEYRALYGIPDEYTYSSTVYDKGADVVHTLRNYLGDDLFFPAVKALMETYQHNDISSFEMRNFLSTQTGIDLTDFFQAWVFSPGFPHFSIDSFKITQTTPQTKVKVWVRQKLNNHPDFANSNHVEITFGKNDWQFYTDSLHFSGQFGSKEFIVPFEPDFAMMDFNEKISDATTDVHKVLKTTGMMDYLTALCRVEVMNISDSAFVRVEHNWVAPDSLKEVNPDIVRLSDYHYWNVDGIFPENFRAKGRFNYNRQVSSSLGNLDDVLLSTIASADSLLLLYRPGAWADWKITHFSRWGTSSAGMLIADTLKKGEYTFAIGTPYLANLTEKTTKNQILTVYPNPSNKIFTFSFLIKEKARLEIYDISGKEIFKMSLQKNRTSFSWDAASYPQGTYFARLISENGNLLAETKLSIVK